MRYSRTFIAVLLIIGCSSDDATGDRRTMTGATGKDAERPPVLDREGARSYFRDGDGKRGAELFAEHRWADAAVAFEKHLATATEKEERARTQLLIGLCYGEQSKWAEALPHFRAAQTGLPLLSDYTTYRVARAYYFTGNATKAEEELRAVDQGSISGDGAELLLGQILRETGRNAEARELYRRYVARDGTTRHAHARFYLAVAAEKTGDAAEALTIYRQITIDSPLSSLAAQARSRGYLLAKNVGVPPQLSSRFQAPLSAAERITRGQVYYDAMQNQLAESDFQAALTTPGITPEQRCVAAYHMANSIFKQRQRRRAAPAFDQAIDACGKTNDVELQVKAAYQAGRSYSNLGEHQTAIERYLLIEDQHPNHSYADDSRLRQAEDYEELGNNDKVLELLSSIPTKYPGGDMLAEAMWRLAWRAFKAKDFPQAVRWLERQIEVVPIDANWWAEGQAQYWLGRAHAELGKPERSVAAYLDAIRLYPLSYYSLLALNRLREGHPKQFEAISREISAASDEASPLTFGGHEVFASPGFARALEFLRLGLNSSAEAELRRLGLVAPPGKDQITDPQTIDRLWAMAFLYHRAGRYETSHWVTRWHVLDYKRHWPTGPWREKWQIAYPPGHWDLIDRHAKEHGFPTELLVAFVREESGFDPRQESSANAIGLTQMMTPTAKRFAKGTGIVVSPETLRNAESNVTIGARFMSFLVSRYSGRIALAIPAYNAGEGATDRWLREGGQWKQDEFGEEIPYDETRRYTKRVIASFFAYTYLRTGQIPPMPNEPLRK